MKDLDQLYLVLYLIAYLIEKVSVRGFNLLFVQF
jgi:hypothetical protein